MPIYYPIANKMVGEGSLAEGEGSVELISLNKLV